MEPWRTVLLVATIVGFLVTAVGLVSAYRAAGREYRAAGERITLMRDLAEQERAEHANVAQGTPEQGALNSAIHVDFDAIYAGHGLVRPSYDNVVYLAQHESQRLLGMVLSETRRDFLIAGVGLLVSTVASAGSLYLASA